MRLQGGNIRRRRSTIAGMVAGVEEGGNEGWAGGSTRPNLMSSHFGAEVLEQELEGLCIVDGQQSSCVAVFFGHIFAVLERLVPTASPDLVRVLYPY